MKGKGWIALDIDGTITLDKYSVPDPVIAYLRELNSSGWKIALATGRAFCFAKIALEKFNFPFVNYYHDDYSSNDYSSPYGFELYDVTSIYGGPGNPIPDELKSRIDNYWLNIRIYFNNTSNLVTVNEELRQLEREEMWN